MKILKQIYHRIRLTFWAMFNLPRKLYVADTDYYLPAWNWMVALLAKIENTRIENGRMWYEPNSHQNFIDILRKGVFFDVGAMVGYYCLVAAHHGAEKVVGFEIIKEYTNFANKALKLNKINGTVINCAIGKGKVSFVDNLTRNSLPAISLDDYCKSSGDYPDTIKMDIEGYESEAIGEKMFIKKPSLQISIHEAFIGKEKASEILETLNKLGYLPKYKSSSTYWLI